jgi:hypothetical protein
MGNLSRTFQSALEAILEALFVRLLKSVYTCTVLETLMLDRPRMKPYGGWGELCDETTPTTLLPPLRTKVGNASPFEDLHSMQGRSVPQEVPTG